MSRCLLRSRSGSRACLVAIGGLLRVRLWCYAHAAAVGVRCALFSADGGVVLFSWLNKIGRCFVRLRLRLASEPASDAGQRRQPATPASDAVQRRRPATPASDAGQRRRPATPPTPRLDSKPTGDSQGHSFTSPVTPTANRGRFYGKTWPCGILEHFRLYLLCFTSVVAMRSTRALVRALRPPAFGRAPSALAEADKVFAR